MDAEDNYTTEEAARQKLIQEVKALKSNNKWNVKIGRYLPLITTLIAIAGFWITLNQQSESQKRSDIQMANELKKSNVSRRLEISKPFIQKRLELYFEAAAAVSVLANSANDEEKQKAEEKFWTLYFGPLVIVEDSVVEKAMIDVGNYLSTRKVNQQQYDASHLKNLSLALSSSCRESIGKSWDLNLDQLKGKYK